MTTLQDISQGPDALRSLISACDDAWWYSNAVAQSTFDARLRQRALESAEHYQELALELIELIMPFDPLASLGRIEGLYERNLEATSGIESDTTALLAELARLEAVVLQRYRELGRAAVPRNWLPTLEAHQKRLRPAIAA